MPLPINFSAVLSELLAQFLFVFICASAASAPIASIAVRGSPRARAGGGRCPPGRARPPRVRARRAGRPDARAWPPNRARRAHAETAFLEGMWARCRRAAGAGRVTVEGHARERAGPVAHHPHHTGTGCATGVANAGGPNGAWIQQVSLTFGLTITVLAYTIGGRSGGHINGAVTLGLFAAKQIKAPNGSSEYKDAAPQAIANIVAQLIGSTVGSAALSTIVDMKADQTGGLGTNGVSDNYSQGEAFFGEIIMTFVLMYVVLETACNPKNAGNIVLAPVAIGFAVYLGHVVLIPIDGCSINPTRSFGPAVVASAQGRTESSRWKDWWVWTFGPCLGALIAVAYYKLVEKVAEFDSTEQQVGTDLEGGGDAAKAFEKVQEFAGKMAADGQANPCEGLENAAQLELFVDHSKKVVEHIEHQAKMHEAKVLTAAARKQLQEIDDTAVGGPGGDE